MSGTKHFMYINSFNNNAKTTTNGTKHYYLGLVFFLLFESETAESLMQVINADIFHKKSTTFCTPLQRVPRSQVKHPVWSACSQQRKKQVCGNAGQCSQVEPLSLDCRSPYPVEDKVQTGSSWEGSLCKLSRWGVGEQKG